MDVDEDASEDAAAAAVVVGANVASDVAGDGDISVAAIIGLNEHIGEIVCRVGQSSHGMAISAQSRIMKPE